MHLLRFWPRRVPLSASPARGTNALKSNACSCASLEVAFSLAVSTSGRLMVSTQWLGAGGNSFSDRPHRADEEGAWLPCSSISAGTSAATAAHAALWLALYGSQAEWSEDHSLMSRNGDSSLSCTYRCSVFDPTTPLTLTHRRSGQFGYGAACCLSSICRLLDGIESNREDVPFAFSLGGTRLARSDPELGCEPAKQRIAQVEDGGEQQAQQR